MRTLPTWGSIAISSLHFCFWQRNYLSKDLKLRIPLVDIDDVSESRAFSLFFHGLSIQVHGAPDVRLDFRQKAVRDEVVAKLKDAVLKVKASELSVEDEEQDGFDSHSAHTGSLGLQRTESPSAMTPNPSQRSSSPRRSDSLLKSHRKSSEFVTHTMPPAPKNVWDSKQTVVLGEDLTENVTMPVGQPKQPMPRVIGGAGTRRVRSVRLVLPSGHIWGADLAHLCCAADCTLCA